MAGTALDHTYCYAHPSGAEDLGRGLGLHRDVCDARKERPYFFEGHMRRLRDAAQLLLVLSDVAGPQCFKRVPPTAPKVVARG